MENTNGEPNDPPDLNSSVDSPANKGSNQADDLDVNAARNPLQSMDEEDGQRSANMDGSHGNLSYNQVSQEIDHLIDSLSSYVNNIKSNGPSAGSPPPEIPDVVDVLTKMLHSEMDRHDDSPERFRFADPKVTDMVSRIARLATLFREISVDPKTDPWVSKTSNVLQRAKTSMADEFRKILEQYEGDPADSNKTSGSNNNNNSSNSSSSTSSNAPDPKTPKSSSSSSLASSFRHAARTYHHRHQSSEQDFIHLVSELSSKDGANDDFPGISEECVNHMSRIATAMTLARYETDCYMVYCKSRGKALRFALRKRGFEKLNPDDIHKMQWEKQLESHIIKWNRVARYAANVVIPREKKLCSSVFVDGYPLIWESMMMNVAKEVVTPSYEFTEAVAKMKGTDRLFRFLELYESMSKLSSEVEGLQVRSKDPTASDLISGISSKQTKLADTVISIFIDFECSVKNDVTKHAVPNGPVHQVTSYTINYLRYACDFTDMLDQVFLNHPNNIHQRAVEYQPPQDDDENNSNNQQGVTTISPFAAQVVRILDLLDANLEEKSKLYKDPSLRCIFLMNNGRYILQKIKESAEMRELVGGLVMRKRSTELRAHHKNYQRESWSKVLQCLNHEGLQVNGKVYKPLLKERFKSFNQMFEDIRRSQTSWVVSDEQLKSELRISIAAVIIPAYRSFVARFSQYFTPGRQTEKYVKHHPDEIETAIDRLFDGSPPTSTTRKKS